MRIPFNKNKTGETEIEFVLEVLAGGIASDGPMSRKCVERIKDELRVAEVLLTPSCTHALELALMTCGLQQGQEVLLPSFTFVSTANAIVARGGKPVFVDIDEETFTIDLDDMAAKVTPGMTVGIIPVHYAGVSCDMRKLMAWAKETGLWVVEDAALAFGSDYCGQPLGTFGTAGCFSFHHTKMISCGEGGALVTNTEEVARRAEICREKGTNRSAFIRNEVDSYTWISEGSSFIIAEPLAGLIMGKLTILEEIKAGLRNVCEKYRAGLAELERGGDIRMQKVPPECSPKWHIFPFLTENEKVRNALLRHLAGKGVEAAFHYIPLHTSPYAREQLGTHVGELPVTERVAGSIVRLPLYTSLSERQVDRVIAAVNEFFGQKPGG